MFILGAVCVGRFVATDIWGGLLTGIMAVTVWYMVTDDCAKMSQVCVLLFGFMCMTNSVLEFVTLTSCLGGRRTSRTESRPMAAEGGASSTTYTVTIETHPFFDDKAGWSYNQQSAMMIVCPIAALLGAALSYYCYHAFPASLFAEGEDGGGGNRGVQNFGGGRLGGGGGGGGGAPIARTSQPAYTTFGGEGHRLGS